MKGFLFAIGMLVGYASSSFGADTLQCEFFPFFDDCGPIVTDPVTGKVTAELKNGRAYLSEKQLCPKGRVSVQVFVNNGKIIDAGLWDNENKSRTRLENVELSSLTLTLRKYHGESAFAFREHYLECQLQ